MASHLANQDATRWPIISIDHYAFRPETPVDGVELFGSKHNDRSLCFPAEKRLVDAAVLFGWSRRSYTPHDCSAAVSASRLDWLLTFCAQPSTVSVKPAGGSAPAKPGRTLSFPSLPGGTSLTTQKGALMSHARKPGPPRSSSRRRLPDWLRDALQPAAHLLAVSVAVAILNGVGVAPVAGECPGSDSRPPIVGVARSDASTMPQSGGSSRAGISAAGPLTWANTVGRDGIEPPTLRFSAG
jgi:hypothetical protein